MLSFEKSSKKLITMARDKKKNGLKILLNISSRNIPADPSLQSLGW